MHAASARPFHGTVISRVAGPSSPLRFRGTSGGSEGLEPDLFYPPRPNRSLIRAAQTLTHWGFSKPIGFEIDVSKEDIARLQHLLKTRDSTILAINHPTLLDPFTSLELARKAGFQFMVMSAVELFEKVKPFSNFLLPRLGSFSVHRGSRDKRETLRTALEVVKNADFPLLIAPEGHITYANRTVAPLKEGAARIAVAAARKGKDVRIIPISLYYQHNRDLTSQLTELAEKLERHTGAPSAADISLLQRTQALFAAMVAERGKRYGIPSPAAGPEAHLEAIKQEMFKRLEAKYTNPDPDTSATYEMRFRRLATHIAERIKQTRGKQEKAVLRQDMAIANDLLELSLHPRNYLVDGEQNRLLETLTRLHHNITGKRLSFFETCRNLTARIKIGEPISVRTHLEEHKMRHSHIPAATEISHRLQAALQAGVDELAAHHTGKLPGQAE